jgi:hypothetical protein
VRAGEIEDQRGLRLLLRVVELADGKLQPARPAGRRGRARLRSEQRVEGERGR